FKSNLDQKEITSNDRTVSEINYWLCLKNIKGIHFIKNDLEKVDFSDKHNKFQLCLFALKEDRTSFYGLISTAIKNNEVTYQNLTEWPILEVFRNDIEYIEIINGMKSEIRTSLREINDSITEAAASYSEVELQEAP
ncbi:MAG: hypothetical protein J7559_14585, partial [Cohnella sp.]|nr:hypothetical protein [Cohnella sp.]